MSSLFRQSPSTVCRTSLHLGKKPGWRERRGRNMTRSISVAREAARTRHAVPPSLHSISAGCSHPCPPRFHTSSACGTSHRRTGLKTIPPALIPRPRANQASPANKNGVFHVKHAVRFPPTARALKPSSSPAPGTFRSRADSAQARRPALPAQPHRSPAHSRNPRSATRPARSVRSATSPPPYRATR